METQKKLQSEKFQSLLTDIGQELHPQDIEHFKYELKKRPPSIVLEDIDSHGRNSGLEVLKRLQEKGFLAEDNLKLLKQLLQSSKRYDLLEKLLKFEKQVKKYDTTSFDVGRASTRETETASLGRRPSIFQRAASYLSNLWRTITRRGPTPSPSPMMSIREDLGIDEYGYGEKYTSLFEVARGHRRRNEEVIVDESEEDLGFEYLRPLTPVPEYEDGDSCLFEDEWEEDLDFVSPLRTSIIEKPPFFFGTILEWQDVTLDVEGGVHDLSLLGVQLQIPPKAVNCPTDVGCYTFSPYHYYLPTANNETLVSYCVGIRTKAFVPQLQKPIIVALNHSGPSKKEGYETIVKKGEPRSGIRWTQIREIQEDSPLAQKHFKSGYIEVEISECTELALAVVTRLITDAFEVTNKGRVVRSSVCDDVTVEFPEGAVDKTYNGSMKLLMMPDHVDILDDIHAYPCPLLEINGFEGVSFKIPVKIRLPHPYPAGCPSGNVRLLTMGGPHEWKDITDQVHCVENESFIEVQVSHFSWSLVSIHKVPLKVASSLSRYLFKVPKDVRFAVFKKAESCIDEFLTMTLVCMPNHKQSKKTAEMKDEGYTSLASSTANKTMRPGDKAYTKVEGCYQKKFEEDIFLKFIKNDICSKELYLRKSNEEEKAANTSGEVIISFLKKKDGDAKDNLCKFCIYETNWKNASKLIEKPRSPKDESGVKRVDNVVLESPTPGPSGRGTEIENQAISRTSVSQAASSKDLELCFGDKSISTIASDEAASKVADFLKLDKLSLDDPPDDIVVKCRELCSYLKSNSRDDIVKKIRDVLPSGMTGPLGDGSLLVKGMDYNLKRRISRALSAKDEWKSFAENVGVSQDYIAFYDRRVENPVFSILDEYCGDMTVEELYFHIVESGSNAIADNHL